MAVTSQHPELVNGLKMRKPNYSLQRDYYCSNDFYEADLEYIWYRSWIFAGHPMEIPEPGDYFTLELGDYSILIANVDHKCKAFHNEYNQQTFCGCLSGHLTTDDLLKINKLKNIHCENICDYLFICLADEVEDISEFRKIAHPYLQPHQLADLKLVAQSSIVENGNWKLVMENNRECYHCTSNHPELIITYPDTPTISGADASGFPQEVIDHWQECEAKGLKSEFYLSEDGTFRLARMPLLKDFTSFTMSGYDAVKKRIEGLEEINIGTLLMFFYPNTWNHFLADQIISFRVLPIDVDKTLVTTKWFINKNAIEGEDYHLEELQYVWNMTNAQDKHLVEENQHGISSPYYQAGPYSTLHEGGLVQFIDWYSDTMMRRISNADKSREFIGDVS